MGDSKLEQLWGLGDKHLNPYINTRTCRAKEGEAGPNIISGNKRFRGTPGNHCIYLGNGNYVAFSMYGGVCAVQGMEFAEVLSVQEAEELIRRYCVDGKIVQWHMTKTFEIGSRREE